MRCAPRRADLGRGRGNSLFKKLRFLKKYESEFGPVFPRGRVSRVAFGKERAPRGPRPEHRDDQHVMQGPAYRFLEPPRERPECEPEDAPDFEVPAGKFGKSFEHATS